MRYRYWYLARSSYSRSRSSTQQYPKTSTGTGSTVLDLASSSQRCTDDCQQQAHTSYIVVSRKHDDSAQRESSQELLAASSTIENYYPYSRSIITPKPYSGGTLLWFGNNLQKTIILKFHSGGTLLLLENAYSMHNDDIFDHTKRLYFMYSIRSDCRGSDPCILPFWTEALENRGRDPTRSSQIQTSREVFEYLRDTE